MQRCFYIAQIGDYFFRSAISYLSVCVMLLLSSCSGLENSEQENLRRNNAKADFILRNHDEFHYTIQTPKQRQREHYPWEGIK